MAASREVFDDRPKDERIRRRIGRVVAVNGEDSHGDPFLLGDRDSCGHESIPIRFDQATFS
jgi:hypothetical protein